MDTTKAITHIGLCAGYGGIELGLQRAIPDLRTVALCEIEAFAIFAASAVAFVASASPFIFCLLCQSEHLPLSFLTSIRYACTQPLSIPLFRARTGVPWRAGGEVAGGSRPTPPALGCRPKAGSIVIPRDAADCRAQVARRQSGTGGRFYVR